MYVDILYVESGDYVSLCEMAKKYNLASLAVRCEVLACRHVSSSDETARELLQYADYLQLHTLWKASASYLLRSRFREQQPHLGKIAPPDSDSGVMDECVVESNAVGASSTDDNEHHSGQGKIAADLNITASQEIQACVEEVGDVEMEDQSAVNSILDKFLASVPMHIYSDDVNSSSK